MRLWLLLLAALLFSVNSHAAGKVALVIGNGAYQNAPALPNPTNDSTDITAMLTKMGFTVIGGNDLDFVGMGAKIGEFEDAARDADVTLLFYAGHGLQVNGRNYLVPINAKLERESSLQFEAIDSENILRAMTGPGKTAIALLDACRNNPLSRSFSRSLGASRSVLVGQGLAVPSITGGGVLIGFATAPGEVAADGDGRNSPFTTALLKNFATPGLEIQQLMTRVKADVFSLTKSNQEPWHNSSLRSEVYLSGEAPTVAVATPEAVAPSTLASSIEFEWSAVKETNSPLVLETFIAKHQDQPLYLALAEERRAKILKQMGAETEAAPEGDAVAVADPAPATATPVAASGDFDTFLGQALDIVNETSVSAAPLQALKLASPAAAPDSKSKKLNLKRVATATSFSGLRDTYSELPSDFEDFATCRTDFLKDGCAFMSKQFATTLNEAMEQRGLDSSAKSSPIFYIIQIAGSKDVLFTSSPKAGDGEVTMAVALVSPSLEVKSSFLVDVSRSRFGIDAGDEKTRFQVTGAMVEDGELYLSIDSGLVCKNKTPLAKSAGFLLRASMADLQLKWVSPFNVSTVNFASDGVSLYTAAGGNCTAPYIYSIDKQTGEVNGRLKLPNGADKLMYVGDKLLVQHYPAASVYGFE
jgi:Caspase domain